jgi:hypothetical protein
MATELSKPPTPVMQSGIVTFGQSNTGWKLNSGTGERTFTGKVGFPAPFSGTHPPTVTVALAGIDASPQDSAVRVKVAPTGVADQSSFDVAITTWAGSAVYNVWVSWSAYK